MQFSDSALSDTVTSTRLSKKILYKKRKRPETYLFRGDYGVHFMEAVCRSDWDRQVRTARVGEFLKPDYVWLAFCNLAADDKK